MDYSTTRALKSADLYPCYWKSTRIIFLVLSFTSIHKHRKRKTLALLKRRDQQQQNTILKNFKRKLSCLTLNKVILCNQRTMKCYVFKAMFYRGWGCCLVLYKLRAYCVLDPEFSTQHLRSNSKASYKAPIQNIQTIKKT